jgi:hypothetical protein
MDYCADPIEGCLRESASLNGLLQAHEALTLSIQPSHTHTLSLSRIFHLQLVFSLTKTSRWKPRIVRHQGQIRGLPRYDDADRA